MYGTMFVHGMQDVEGDCYESARKLVGPKWVWQRFATKWAIWTTRVQFSTTGSEFENCETSPLVHNMAILHQARM